MTLFGLMCLGPGLRSFAHWAELSCRLIYVVIMTGASAASCVEAAHSSMVSGQCHGS